MKILYLGSSGQGRAPDQRSEPVLAVQSLDGRWLLVNISAAVAHSLCAPTAASPAQPDRRKTDGAAAALPPGWADAASRSVVLTDARIEWVEGLLALRDGPPIDLYATPWVFEALAPAMPVLQASCGLRWHLIAVAGDVHHATFQVGGMGDLQFTALAVDCGSTDEHDAPGRAEAGRCLALAIRDLGTGQLALCAPRLARLDARTLQWMRSADCLLLDGPAGPGDSAPSWLRDLATLPARHKVWVGDQPIPADPQLARHGIARAYDRMEIAL